MESLSPDQVLKTKSIGRAIVATKSPSYSIMDPYNRCVFFGTNCKSCLRSGKDNENEIGRDIIDASDVKPSD